MVTPPWSCVASPAVPKRSVVRLKSRAFPPTVPPKIVWPPVLTVSAYVSAVRPSTVEVKETLPLPVLPKVVAAPRVTAPV